MANVDNKSFYFERKNYFLRFTSTEDDVPDKTHANANSISRSVRHALEYFVDDLRRDRDKTIERFLNETTINDIFRSVTQLLLCDDDRICGNSAYIMGSVIELESGLKRFLTIFSTDRTSNTIDIIRVLCHLLTHSDSECILNAAGTLGTICGSEEGRNLILHHTCISQLITNTSALLSSTNSWIASNAALVLARLTVEELGCQAILTHSKHREILNQILSALNISDANRSTNAAFAIGRLIEGDEGKKILISACGQYKIFDALLLMLKINEEKGVNKNACYALSCLCTTELGFQLCLQYLTVFHHILLAIEIILSSTEHETVWFALMCLRTIVQYDGATEHLNHSKILIDKLKEIKDKWLTHKDIQDEAKLLWYLMHKNIKPSRPKIDECRKTSADISWIVDVHNWYDKELKFRILLNNQPMGETEKTNYCLETLQPNTKYRIQIQYVTPQGDNIPSDETILHTDDELPPPVNNLHVERTTMTAARVSWDPPDLTACNSLRGYQTYLNDVEHECTTECEVTIGSLTASTTYQIDVCAVTNKGKGPRASINVTTASAGDSNPSPPTFSVIGRREIYVKWQAPEVIAGRLTRYELICNRRSIYSGTAQEHRATMLKSDTEYKMEVIAITNEGRFRSKIAKTRTLKDEFTSAHRHSLYEPLPQSPPKLKRTETVHSLHTSGTIHTASSKPSPPAEHRLSREVTVSTRNVETTTVRSLQLKSENTANNRALPILAKGVQARPPDLIKQRHPQRARTDPLFLNQLQPQTRITASVLIPTLDTDREPQVTWASPVTLKAAYKPAYRLSTTAPDPPSILLNSKQIERSASNSFPDPSLNITRTQSFSQS